MARDRLSGFLHPLVGLGSFGFPTSSLPSVVPGVGATRRLDIADVRDVGHKAPAAFAGQDGTQSEIEPSPDTGHLNGAGSHRSNPKLKGGH